MTPLVEAQRLLAAVVDQSADGAATARLHALIAADARGLGVAKRLSVYRDSSRRARERALESIYPVCRQVLGPRCFATLASGYVAECPSTTGDLNLYGAALPRFLEAQVRDHADLAQLPYLADLARMEWLWHAVYYAPNDPDFDLSRFSALTAKGNGDRVRFHLSAALRLLASDYPISEIWRRHRRGGDTSAVAMGDGDRLIIRRVDFLPKVESVEPEIFALLTGLREGKALASLAEEGHAIETIPGLVAAGWVVGFSIV